MHIILLLFRLINYYRLFSSSSLVLSSFSNILTKRSGIPDRLNWWANEEIMRVVEVVEVVLEDLFDLSGEDCFGDGVSSFPPSFSIEPANFYVGKETEFAVQILLCRRCWM